MMCENCVSHVRKALESVEGSKVVDVSLKDHRAIIRGDTIKGDEIRSAISKAGYEVTEIRKVKETEDNKMTKTLKIEGMMCKHCVMHVKEALEKMDGVTKAEVSLEKKEAVVTCDKDIDVSLFRKVIEEAGYKLL